MDGCGCMDGWMETTGSTVLKCTMLSQKHIISFTVISTCSCHQCPGHCWAHIPFSQLQVQPEQFINTCVTPSSNPLMTSCLPILNLKGLFLSLEESNFFPFCSIPVKTRHTVSVWDTSKFKCWRRGKEWKINVLVTSAAHLHFYFKVSFKRQERQLQWYHIVTFAFL